MVTEVYKEMCSRTEFKDDKRHRQGTFVYVEGVYDGKQKDGKRYGEGTLTSADGIVKKGV